MPVKFLIDENSWRKALVRGLKGFDPSIDVLHVGEEGAPPNHAKDPEILLYCEQEQRLLISRDRTSMPVHVREHLRAGHHHWGVLCLRPGHTIGDYYYSRRYERMSGCWRDPFAGSVLDGWRSRLVSGPLNIPSN
jgi:hypothetical protein